TGAPNLFAYQGQGPLDPPLWACFAKEGAELIDAYSDEPKRAILQGRKIRGIYNKSMVCSERELGLGDDHTGIILLEPELVAGHAPGTPLQDVLGDVILDIELTPNLARCWSMVGVAREVAALLDTDLRLPSTAVQMDGAPIAGQVQIDIREPELNPRFTLSLIKNVTIKPSPQWMQMRLKKAGMRPINNIVDITNYAMLEIGQPLHAFDWDIIKRRATESGAAVPTIITRLPEPGERLALLDGSVHELDPFNILVADTAGSLSLGGIMGGLESEVQPDSTNILLEAANWNFINVRRTMRARKINSEAGVRFSRGVHPSQAELGLLRATELMRTLGDGTVAAGIIDAYPLPPETVTVEITADDVARLAGRDYGSETIAAILRRLQFDVQQAGDALRVTVPDHRMDISHGVIGVADLVEEVTRIHGYDNIPNTLMADALPAQRDNVALEGEAFVQDRLVYAGLSEIITYRFTTPEREAQLVPPGAQAASSAVEYVRLANPISQDKTVLRRTLLAGMCGIAATNARHTATLRFFEIGKVFLPVADAVLPDEPRHLGVIMLGPRNAASWDLPAREGLLDFYDLKGTLENLLGVLHVPDVNFTPATHPAFFPGRVAALSSGKQHIGVLGELHPKVCAAFDLPEDLPVMAAEFDLDVLLAAAQLPFGVVPVPTQPAVYQDIALVVNAQTPAAEVEAVIRAAGGELLEAVRLFDVYTGDPIPQGSKSLAYALTFRAPDQTLTDKQVNKAREKIVKAARQKLDATLRE
ncbi:MAG: phenylalanine--tRNA ligase subunit beta, partial [Anaerolineae bacterium]|nr:phenylalanine--tRNA ligase subunit beta [Anaerolineae bacterium]